MDFGNQFGGQPMQSTGVLNLAKGGVLDLDKVAPALKHVILGCGWDVASNGPTADLDLSAILVPKGARITQQNAMEHVKLSEWFKTHLLVWLTKKRMMKFVVMN